MSAGLTEVCRAQADRARQLIADARAGLDYESRRRLLVPEIWADVYLSLLDRLEAARFDVFERRPYLPRRRKLALAVRRWAAYLPPAAIANRASRFFPGPRRLW
jgi:phytoene/squalene synthetase